MNHGDSEEVAFEARHRAAELLAVLDSSRDLFMLFGADGRLRYLCPRLAQAMGFEREPVGADYQVIFDHFPALGRKHGGWTPFGEDELFADRGRVHTDEIEVERPRRTYRRFTAPVRGPEGEYFGRMFVFSDVTVAREVDRARSDFLAVASHELRTPLTPLSLQLESMARQLKRRGRVTEEAIGKAQHQLARLTQLIEGLLDFSQLEAGQLDLDFEPLSFARLVIEAVETAREAHRHAEFTLNIPDDAAFAIRGNAPRLRHVVRHLLDNAVKFGGSESSIGVSLHEVGDEIRLSVSDRGIGIPNEDQPRLFQQFFRGSNVDVRHYGGVGLSLNYSTRIVERHGGRMEVDSQPGRGSTFHLALPKLIEPKRPVELPQEGQREP
ncbi:MAG: sensor histidine kinase [Deltaproteobacteria bacterium]